MKLDISPETIKKQYSSWESKYAANSIRGKEMIMFTDAGEQWNEARIANRTINNKESLTFNMCLKHSRKMKSEARQVEFTLTLAPVNTDYEDVEEVNAFRMLFTDLMLSEDSLRVYSSSLDKCLDFGYSFMEVNYKYENDKTLCSRPDLRLHENPAIGFWDRSSLSPFKTDGRFCGLKREVSKHELMEKIDKIPGSISIYEKGNVLVDYWFRKYTPAKFLKLNTGVFKREDLITSEDRKMIEIGLDNMPITQSGRKSEIYFIRMLNDVLLEKKPKLFPTDDLPLVYHPALTFWTPDGYLTFPFTFALKGPQELHNYMGSQIATMAKNSSSDKWFFAPENVSTEDQQLSASKVNTKEGGFLFGGDISKIQRHQSAEIPNTMIQLMQVTQQEIDTIGGSMIDAQQSDNVVMSGLALDKITHNMSILNSVILSCHIEFVDEVARIQRQMIPRLYTENRTIIVKESDGGAQSITINQPLSSGKIKNSIRDISDTFHYKISAGPSSSMEKENTLKALMAGYALDPTVFADTKDIWAKCLNTSFSDEISRRLSTKVDPKLIAYGQGKITDQQWQEYQGKVNQDKEKLAESNPAVKAQMALAAAEDKKGQAAQFDAQTKRMAAQAKARNDNDKLELELTKLIKEKHDNEREQQIQHLQQEIENNQQIINGIDANAAAAIPNQSG